jgi:thioredoxin 1
MKEVTDATWKEEIGAQKLIIKFFTAHCGPCRMQDPILQELESDSEFSDVSWVRINGATNPETTTHFGVTSVPTLIVLHNGEIKEKLVGHFSKEHLLRGFKSAFAS